MLVRTNDVVSTAQLKNIYSRVSGSEERIDVDAGSFIREGDGWRFYLYRDDDEEDPSNQHPVVFAAVFYSITAAFTLVVVAMVAGWLPW